MQQHCPVSALPASLLFLISVLCKQSGRTEGGGQNYKLSPITQLFSDLFPTFKQTLCGKAFAAHFGCRFRP